jgi:hypothetical protein
MKSRLSLIALVFIGLIVVPPQTVSAKPQALPKCPTANFMNLSKSVGAGPTYAKPSQKIACSATEIAVTTNNMISFPFVQLTPHPLSPQNMTIKFPRAPKVAATPTNVVNMLGTAGVTVSGLVIYPITEGAIPVESAYGDPYYNKMLDTCGGHTGPASEYHYHVLITVAICNLKNTGVLGYAIDGFPIYGPTACLNVKCTKKAAVKSGYVQIGNPQKNVWNAYKYSATPSTTVLDECNGRVQPDGTYGYHATMTFPYIFGCFKGTPTTQTGGAAAPMNMGGGSGGSGQQQGGPPPLPGGQLQGGPPPIGGPPPVGGPPPSTTVKSNSVDTLSIRDTSSFYCNLPINGEVR